MTGSILPTNPWWNMSIPPSLGNAIYSQFLDQLGPWQKRSFNSPRSTAVADFSGIMSQKLTIYIPSSTGIPIGLQSNPQAVASTMYSFLNTPSGNQDIYLQFPGITEEDMQTFVLILKNIYGSFLPPGNTFPTPIPTTVDTWAIQIVNLTDSYGDSPLCQSIVAALQSAGSTASTSPGSALYHQIQNLMNNPPQGTMSQELRDLWSITQISNSYYGFTDRMNDYWQNNWQTFGISSEAAANFNTSIQKIIEGMEADSSSAASALLNTLQPNTLGQDIFFQNPELNPASINAYVGILQKYYGAYLPKGQTFTVPEPTTVDILNAAAHKLPIVGPSLIDFLQNVASNASTAPGSFLYNQIQDLMTNPPLGTTPQELQIIENITGIPPRSS